jgi:hypothetical protein
MLSLEAGVMPSKGSILLGEVAAHLATVDISCNFCPRRGTANVSRLMQEHGPDMPIPELLRQLAADCPRRQAARVTEPCGANLPQLAVIFREGR